MPLLSTAARATYALIGIHYVKALADHIWHVNGRRRGSS